MRKIVRMTSVRERHVNNARLFLYDTIVRKNPLKDNYHCTQKMKFSIKDFFIRCDHADLFTFTVKSLMENFTFCEVDQQGLWQWLQPFQVTLRKILDPSPPNVLHFMYENIFTVHLNKTK